MADDPEAIALVEKVAKAIYEADDPWHAAWPWPNPRDNVADKIRDIAKAAIAETLKAAEAEMPDDIDLFRAIRSAGRRDRDKVTAVLKLMPNFAMALQKIGGGESLTEQAGNIYPVKHGPHQDRHAISGLAGRVQGKGHLPLWQSQGVQPDHAILDLQGAYYG